MLYFFHHYELPMILQQAQLQQLLYRNHAQPAQQQQQQQQPPAPGSGAVPTTPATAPTQQPQQQQQQPSEEPRPQDPRTQHDYISDLSRLENLPGVAHFAAAFQARQAEAVTGELLYELRFEKSHLKSRLFVLLTSVACHLDTRLT